MRVLLVNQFFHPDLAATAQIVSDLGEDLASRGAQVTAVTGQASYLGGARYPRRDFYKGVEVLRIPTTGFGRATMAGRVADYLSFFAGCVGQLSVLPPQDVIVTLSTPPLLGVAGMAEKLMTQGRTKFVYWVQDLYPEVALRLGVLSRRSPSTWALERLGRRTLRSADAVVALGEAMAEKLEAKGAPASRLYVVHNWSDSGVGAVEAKDNWFLDRHGLRGKFVVLYSGNMGRGHELGTIIEVARVLKEDARVAFVFIGEGARRKEIEEAAAELPNVKLLPYQRREDLPFSLGSANLMVVSLADGLEGLIVPSKLYGALAARKPVLYLGPEGSEAARIVTEEGCGAAFKHGQVDAVTAFIRRLASEPEAAVTMGEKGRVVFERRYDRRIATARFAELLCEVCGGRGRRAQPC